MNLLLLLAVVCGLAYANGANDNFKGVATLLGSGTTTYRRALAWTTVTTFLGSLTAVFLAEQLLKNFSGRGLVDPALVGSTRYVGSVALAAALTVLLASRLGMPISTTHSLVGALVGAGWAAGSALNTGKLAADFFLPLLVSPLLAISLTAVAYPWLHRLRLRLGISAETCLCVGSRTVEVLPAGMQAVALERAEQLSVTLGDQVVCRQRYQGRVAGIGLAAALDRMHYLSAGAVSFARGLNDTPKIAALLLVAPQLGGAASTLAIAVCMALGGLIGARRVAEVMGCRITTMNHSQGLIGNLATSSIVIAASRLGLPVSTTHVSCGALFGIGATTGKANLQMIATIVLAWVTTLPVSALLAAAAWYLLGSSLSGGA